MKVDMENKTLKKEKCDEYQINLSDYMVNGIKGNLVASNYVDNDKDPV